MLSVEQALVTILSNIQPVGAERAALPAVLGRVLAEDVIAPFNVPPFANSAMDGYAVHHADIAGASPERPVTLPVAGDLPAGATPPERLLRGQALRIMTGAVLPEGADTVVMQEDTRAGDGTVSILKAPAKGANIRYAGEDIKEGEVLFACGTRLRPAHVGVLASIKRAVVSVYRQVRVSIVSTGNELIDIDQELLPGTIVTSNSYSLAALVVDCGALPVVLPIARDTRDDLTSRLREALTADLILTSGGVSVGDYDVVKPVLQELGCDMKFWKVAMRPGQPLAFGTIGTVPVFGLPGNPVSAMVTFELFVRPALRKMGGLATIYRRPIKAVSRDRIASRPGRMFFVRCVVTEENGVYYATMTGEQGSGMLTSMARANGLMIIPDTKDGIAPGDTVSVQILDPDFNFADTVHW
ncbi:MAG: molybdopterin molybdotransferase MoeA [Desulfobacterota bacterium]|nr:molybdopterin molybdotransferase MoeA [Thermodesulfobacteriota bacterium]